MSTFQQTRYVAQVSNKRRNEQQQKQENNDKKDI
jgi:hypothetical protein